MNTDPTPTNMAPRPRVAVLGAGTMGAAMARRLLAADFVVDVWDRTPTAVDRLADKGAGAHTDVRAAVAGADVVLTVLPTGDAVTEVMLSAGALDAMRLGAVWAQMGTIGAGATDRLGGEVLARRPDIRFVDAPVSGSREPAETGQLLVLASGPDGVEETLTPVFAALGRRSLWLGAAGAGSRMKLVLNTWLAFQVEGAAECAALADGLGVPHPGLLEALAGGPLASGLALAKLAKIDSGDYRADFSLQWALKDLDLAGDAAGEDVIPIAFAIAERWRLLVQQDLGHLDISAVRLGLGAQWPTTVATASSPSGVAVNATGPE
ncbi:MAG: NAD(P)-dependent oxidoreductase [Chloroflexi bacterium]|nr:NAD(P)-dependent oxidoreductase [Chloroflexota bacterium]